MALKLNAFIDVTECAESAAAVRAMLERWQQLEYLGGLSGQVSVAVPAGSQQAWPSKSGWFFFAVRPVVVLDAALQRAAEQGAALLVLTGAFDVRCEAIGVLHQRATRDPMFGFSIPRVSCRNGCCIASLTKHGAGPAEWIPRKVLSDLPESEILVETLSPCIFIAAQVAANFGSPDSELATMQATLLHLMASARRCGFRTVLCNRAVVAGDGLECASHLVAPVPKIPDADLDRLRNRMPELDRSWQEFRAAAWQRFEHLSAQVPVRAGGRPSLLIDLRNVGPMFNGTTHAALSLTRGFRELVDKWDIALLADPLGAVFHDFARIFPRWPVYTARPDRTFAVAFRPTQPWHVQDLTDLHDLAQINAYLVLDVISWDIVYWAPPQIESVWQLLADTANGLLYDSEFTRQRFLERFPGARSVPDQVTLFSFDSRDYHGGKRRLSGDGPFALVVGNQLDHKDVLQTVNTLAAAFPYQTITAIGPVEVASPLVTAKQSGQMSEAEVQNLYASAQFVVYPSFYEGFGFPIVNALAYGQTVLARRSALLDELAGHCEQRGRLIGFDRREELVHLIGRLMNGETVPQIPLGGARNGAPARTWRQVASDIHEFLGTLIRDSARQRWLARERMLARLPTVPA